jgi:protein-S-isoprenylcysteine O-methyltransferase Ste14
LLRHRTSVLPHRGSDARVTAGPFAISRNPIYLGNVLLTVGLALVFANPLLLATAIVEAVLLERLAIVPEERHLEARFGDAWHDYRLKTPRWVRIPLRLCVPGRLGVYRTRT